MFIEDPAIRRAAVASVTPTTVLAIGGQPGKAFEVSPWEYSFRALAVDPPEAFAIFDQGIARFPTNAGLRYNLACVYAREGQRDAALASLGQAIKLDTRALEWAAGDEDFASLRDDPEFRAAVAAR